MRCSGVAEAIVVERLKAARHESWNEYVRGHPEGTFFHLAAWEQVLLRAFRHRSHYLLAHRDGRLCGVLPLAEVRSLLFGHTLVSTPFCVYGGILADDDVAARALQDAACALARELEVDYLEMRDRRRRHPDWPYRDLYVTFRKEISGDADVNLKAIPNRQRAMIRKGAKNGLRVEVDQATDRHYAVYSESLRNLGTPVFAKRYLDILKEAFGPDCEVQTATHGGKAVASVISFYFRDEVLPYYGGSVVAARSLAANDFLYWEVMERARSRGMRLFDFGRSKQGTGSFNFKKYWGFEPAPLYYEYYLVRAKQIPNLNPTNPKYHGLIAVWQRLPVPVTRVIGPWLAGALG